jgi:hypothetical protein
MPFWQMHQYAWALSDRPEEGMSERRPSSLGPDDHAYRLLMMTAEEEEEEERRERERRRISSSMQLGSGPDSSSRSHSRMVRRRDKLKEKKEEEKEEESSQEEEEWNLEDPASLPSEEFDSLEGFVDDSYVIVDGEEPVSSSSSSRLHSRRIPRRVTFEEEEAEGKGEAHAYASPTPDGEDWGWLARMAAEAKEEGEGEARLSSRDAGSSASAASLRSASEMIPGRGMGAEGSGGPSEQPPPLSAGSWAEFNSLLESKRTHEASSSSASSEAFHALGSTDRAHAGFSSGEDDPAFRIEDYGGAAAMGPEWAEYGAYPPPEGHRRLLPTQRSRFAVPT